MRIFLIVLIGLIFIGNVYASKETALIPGKIEYIDGRVENCFFKVKNGEIDKKRSQVYLTFSVDQEPEVYSLYDNLAKGVIIEDSIFYGLVQIMGMRVLALRIVEGVYEVYQSKGHEVSIKPNYGHVNSSTPYNTTGALSGGSMYYPIVKDGKTLSSGGGKKALNKYFGNCAATEELLANYKNKYGYIKQGHIDIATAYNENCVE